jgi:DNA helicase HerA-like ATPase
MIKKIIPLLLSFKLYREHKELRNGELHEYLNIIVDEAHNILSYESQRESESWKDFRLETFEEIIKEGRKFGVFMTIASQRPSDISSTIISQLHNYLIHRLINNRDLEMVEKAISYLDKVSVESLPVLPVGACVLSGLIADLPVIVQVDKLSSVNSPKSDTIDLLRSWMDDEDGV